MLKEPFIFLNKWDSKGGAVSGWRRLKAKGQMQQIKQIIAYWD